MAEKYQFEPFPVCDLVPKKETGAERFLSKNSTYDGRGVVIAIFDTGVDPGADGLQVTTTGERKILDLIDTSGSGDVDTSHVARVQEDGTVQGLTGRKLKIPEDWVNPSGDWHLGCKALYEMFPSDLISRLNKTYVDKVWDPQHNKAVADAARELAEFEKKHKSDKLSYEEKLAKADLQAKVDVLNDLSKKVKSPGPVVDCVVFHDGEGWRAVVDTTEGGDLESCTVLSPFAESGMYANFGCDDCLNYSVNIYEDGNVLSLVTAGGSHGTHVASIAAGNFPDNPERNGIAPGAQIIGFKIGDSRLKTMETASALVRAASIAAKMKVDLVNFSYGEVAHWNDDGAVLKQFRDLVDVHGAVFVSSAGNNGPALSTVGTPGGNTSSLIGVSAFVSPEMMATEYSLSCKKPSIPYTWSSRGPTVDGGAGVSITAPGGAIASVSNYSLRCSQLMNGTSMSSPNACGGIGLVLSALKAEGVSYNPALIKLCVENTATPLPGENAFSNGCGVLQVDKAVEYVMDNVKTIPPSLLDVHFTVTTTGKKRGVYLRESFDIKKSSHLTQVTPVFHKDAASMSKLTFDLRLALVCSDSWVTAPKHLSLQNATRSFYITVDPTGLVPGAHFAEVCAIDTTGAFKGPLFRVPITALVPSELEGGKKFSRTVEFKKGKLLRFFLHPPKCSTWAEFTVTGEQTDQAVKVCLHTVQLMPECAFRKTEHFEFISLQPSTPHKAKFPIKGGRTIELCIGQWWNETLDCTAQMDVTFHSLLPSVDQLTLHAGLSYAAVNVLCELGPEELAPEFKLTHQVLTKRPVDAVIVPLGERDQLPNTQQSFALNLTYKFTVSGSKSVEVRPILTLLNDVLYECPYTSQLWMLYDSNKQLLLTGDAYKKQYSVNLEKGDYTIKAQIKHEQKSQLEKIKDTPLVVEMALPSSLTLDVYGCLKEALSCGSKLSSLKMKPGELQPLYIMAAPEDKMPKGIISCDLKGQFTLQKNNGDKRNKGPVNYDLKYVCTPKQSKKAPAPSTSTGEADNSEDVYKRALRDFKLNWMKKNPSVVKAESLAEEYGDDLEYLSAKLHVIDEVCVFSFS
jgi:tripeptidyl-peptidase-2